MRMAPIADILQFSMVIMSTTSMMATTIEYMAITSMNAPVRRRSKSG